MNEQAMQKRALLITIMSKSSNYRGINIIALVFNKIITFKIVFNFYQVSLLFCSLLIFFFYFQAETHQTHAAPQCRSPTTTLHTARRPACGTRRLTLNQPSRTPTILCLNQNLSLSPRQSWCKISRCQCRQLRRN